jgi:hypothetical protein
MTEFGWMQESQYWIEMYDDKNFADRRFVLYGTSGNYLPNYNHVYVDGEWGHNDKVSSVKWFLPEGTFYSLFEHDTYGGMPLLLIGTGEIEGYPDLGSLGFNDKTSSSRFFSP